MTDLNRSSWLDLPCTRCISNGLSSECAGRRSRIGNYYCKACNSQYQRDRNRRLSLGTQMRRGDIDEIAASMTRFVERLGSLDAFEADEMVMLRVQAAEIDTHLQALLVRLAERVDASPRRSSGSGKVKTEEDLAVLIAEGERAAGLARKFYRQNARDNRPALIYNLKQLLKLDPDYDGPAIQDLDQFGLSREDL